ncbi:U-box domain-containing protein [Thalictrum thalictroides]|uniref:RING-type E3 ubiquitin transferase n=1 Tax=Thalictrum thalictroides TaxID=46969 RepID=A0A7J6X1E0_THATH|nr:U-box domain-containing protein [Thalictrum thalictroides]
MGEPVQKYYQKIDEILKLLRPILNVLVDSQITSNEEVNKIFEELDGLVNEFKELVESWHPTTSKFCFVMQVESLIARIQATCLDGLQLVSSLHQYLPDDMNPISVVHSVQKLRCIGYEQTSTVIKEAIRAVAENSTLSSETMVKIADSLSLTSNQELLLEAVALEKAKFQAEQDENDTEAKCIGHMICLVRVMHDLLVKINQSRSITTVPIPADFCCPLSLELMMDPVIVASGQTYERIYIRRWLDLGLTVCPKTRQTLAHTNLIPNYTVKAFIANWCEANNVTIPDPVKSMDLNQTAPLHSHADSGPRDSHTHPHSAHASTRANHVRSNESTRSIKTNLVRSTESVRSTSLSHKSTHSHGGTKTERKSRSHDFDGALNGEVGNGYGLDVGGILLGRSEDGNIGSGGEPHVPSKEDNSEASGTDDQFHAHCRNASVSSSVSNTEYIQGTPGNVNEVSQGSGDLTHYSSNASGELALDSPSRASLHPHGESEFSPRLMATQSRSHTIWCQPTESYAPRIVSASAIVSRTDLLGIETQLKKLVEDLQSTSIDLKRAATAELRLLAKDAMNNRIVIANSGAIPLLVGLLHSADIHTQENAVTALLNLSINDNNKIAITNADAIEPLVHVLETGSAVAKENSAATLFSLSVIEENKARIGRSGAIGPLVGLLGNGTPRGKKDAATALFNLSLFHENKAQVVQAGAVKYLVELMDPADGLVDKAVAVLANLAAIPEGRSAIGVAGGIPVLVEVVELGSARCKEHAAAALLQLCTNSYKFCSMVLQEGAVPPLVALSQSGTSRAKEKAQALLSHFRKQRHGNAARR